MNETVRQWIDKADGDFDAAKQLIAGCRPNFDAICYHAQQCIEKLMKAVLIYRGVHPPRTHNLVWLNKLLEPVCSEWTVPSDDLEFLTRAAGAFRYPGASAEHEDAAEAMKICTRLRELLLKILYLNE